MRLVRRGDPALVLDNVAAEENARLIVGRGRAASSPAGSWGASPTWAPSARPATC
jgi:hypothetical protein